MPLKISVLKSGIGYPHKWFNEAMLRLGFVTCEKAEIFQVMG